MRGDKKYIHFCQNTGKEKTILEDNILVILQEIRYDGVEWINLAQKGIITVCFYEYSNDPSGSSTQGECFENAFS
jgi:hypothetical protein